MQTATKERPILFSGPMVRAILDSRKTQTRRVVKAKDSDPDRCITLRMLMRNVQEWRLQDGRWFGLDGWDTLVFADCPYGQVGNRLWVRETWCQAATDDGYFKYNAEGNLDSSCCHYRADGYEVVHIDGEETASGQPKSPWVPSIHMPRWASRITLERLLKLVEVVVPGFKLDPKQDHCDCVRLLLSHYRRQS